MIYRPYEMLWLFLLYSLIGWLAETALAAARRGRILNRGFLSLPFSPIYGCGWMLFAIFLPELRERPFYLFLGGVILATGLEFFTGILLEHLTGRKWWDYSNSRFQFEGHVSLIYSVIWGLCALVCLFFSDGLLLWLVHKIPKHMGELILWVIYILLGIDFAASAASILQIKCAIRLPDGVAGWIQKLTAALDNVITRAVQRRLMTAYPNLEREGSVSVQKQKPECFAQGLCFYKLVSLFFIAAFLGDLVEMVFCRITSGTWMSRSSVVYGQFSVVWGLGAVMLTAVLYRHRGRSDGFIFLLGTVLGGAYEYVCSVFTELMFGTVFWDYSQFPFNLGGRINLLYCFFWGIASVVWLKYAYPFISAFIERIPQKLGKVLTWGMLIFMIFDAMLSGAVLSRYEQRQGGEEVPESGIVRMIDRRFPDARVEARYPNLILVE